VDLDSVSFLRAKGSLNYRVRQDWQGGLFRKKRTINSVGHVYFSPEFAGALRVTDVAPVVVGFEDVHLQTQAVPPS